VCLLVLNVCLCSLNLTVNFPFVWPTYPLLHASLLRSLDWMLLIVLASCCALFGLDWIWCYCFFVVCKYCCVLTASCIYCINFNGTQWGCFTKKLYLYNGVIYRQTDRQQQLLSITEQCNNTQQTGRLHTRGIF
jgi:hypothetical protein